MNESERILAEAVEALEKAISKDPMNGPFLYGMAALLALEGKPAQAMKYLKRAESLGVNGSTLRKWLSQNFPAKSLP